MLTSVEQLEKEIETFHQNVVASNELMSSMKSIADILSRVPDDIKSDYDDMLKRFVSVVGKLQKEIEDSESNINSKYTSFLSHLETLNLEQVHKVCQEIKAKQDEIEKANTANLEQVLKICQEIKGKQDEIEKANTTNMEAFVASIKEHVSKKMMLLYCGVGAIIVLLIVSLFM